MNQINQINQKKLSWLNELDTFDKELDIFRRLWRSQRGMIMTKIQFRYNNLQELTMDLDEIMGLSKKIPENGTDLNPKKILQYAIRNVSGSTYKKCFREISPKIIQEVIQFYISSHEKINLEQMRIKKTSPSPSPSPSSSFLINFHDYMEKLFSIELPNPLAKDVCREFSQVSSIFMSDLKPLINKEILDRRYIGSNRAVIINLAEKNIEKFLFQTRIGSFYYTIHRLSSSYRSLVLKSLHESDMDYYWCDGFFLFFDESIFE